MIKNVVTSWLAGESNIDYLILVTDGVSLTSFGITIGTTEQGLKGLCSQCDLGDITTWIGNRRRLHWSIARYLIAIQ